MKLITESQLEKCFLNVLNNLDVEDVGPLAEIIEKAHQYRWHDLRKDPTDLPEIAGVYLTICEERVHIIREYSPKLKGFLDRWGHDLKTHQREGLQIIAWKEIEPFGEV